LLSQDADHSRTVSGFACAEWADLTTFSEATPSRWALSYATTPSVLPLTGPPPSTAMMEWTVTPLAIGLAERARTKGLSGLMLSTAVGSPSSDFREIAPGFSRATSPSPFTALTGRVTSQRTKLRASIDTRKLPRCGVHMNTTRLTEGTGSKNIVFWMRSRVARDALIWEKGTRLTLFQKRVPLSVTMSRVRRPPWLCPISTMRRRAGSRPSGSSSFRMSRSAFRSLPAESRTGVLVL
jgi:hypothetical protein